MMVLLPLRGWAGDAMATEMALNSAVQQMHQTAPTKQKADAHGGHQSPEAYKSHSDHAAHDAQTHVTVHTADGLDSANCDQTHDVGHGAGHGLGHVAGNCESCSACQACPNVALLVDTDHLKLRFNSIWTPTAGADPFVSADAAPDQKPPIS
jgi:hypothetical protein